MVYRTLGLRPALPYGPTALDPGLTWPNGTAPLTWGSYSAGSPAKAFAEHELSSSEMFPDDSLEPMRNGAGTSSMTMACTEWWRRFGAARDRLRTARCRKTSPRRKLTANWTDPGKAARTDGAFILNLRVPWTVRRDRMRVMYERYYHNNNNNNIVSFVCTHTSQGYSKLFNPRLIRFSATFLRSLNHRKHGWGETKTR